MFEYAFKRKCGIGFGREYAFSFENAGREEMRRKHGVFVSFGLEGRRIYCQYQ